MSDRFNQAAMCHMTCKSSSVKTGGHRTSGIPSLQVTLADCFSAYGVEYCYQLSYQHSRQDQIQFAAVSRTRASAPASDAPTTLAGTPFQFLKGWGPQPLESASSKTVQTGAEFAEETLKQLA